MCTSYHGAYVYVPHMVDTNCDKGRFDSVLGFIPIFSFRGHFWRGACGRSCIEIFHKRFPFFFVT